MSYLGYPEYTMSSNQWVGSTPSHWKFLRADFTSTSNKLQVGTEEMEEVQVFHYSIPNVQEFGTAQIEEGKDIDSSKTRVIEKQLLISKLNPRKATICIAKPHKDLLTVCSGEFVPILPEHNLCLRYCYYAWVSDKVTKLLSSMVQSVTRSHQRVNPNDIRKLPWSWPPAEEQEKIADFLDWKTGQIDELIAKKKQLIEKLKEQRMALITQAVTKGLNPDAPMRESDIPWLGEVPAHWEVIRLRYCTSFVTSGARGWAKYFSDSGDLFLRIVNLDRESIELKLNDLQRVEPPVGAEGFRTLTQDGDLLISITADLGSVAVVRPGFESAYVSQHLCLVRLNKENLNPNWIAYSVFAQSGNSQLQMAGYGGTKVQLSLTDIKELVFCYPTKQSEQATIIKSIKSRTDKIDLLIKHTERAINTLFEYRTALIIAATTGKIDVRNVKIGGAA